ncbi:MAG TPA: peptidase S1 [Bacteroidetes bacterium]|nr:peptidase S1 [Bacteroidota bacterium]HIL57516.1 peptidase S1 [Rhodothermales bacterium]
MTTFLRLSALATLLFSVSVAQAQPDRNASPRATLDVAGDLAEVSIQAGGNDRVAVQGSGCSGYITNTAPNGAVMWSGSGALSIYAVSGEDATIVVSDPDGRFHCSDDANGSNPAVTIAQAKSGRYLVWVGLWEPGTAGATLKAKGGQPAW